MKKRKAVSSKARRASLPARRKIARPRPAQKKRPKVRVVRAGHWVSDEEFGKLRNTLREAQETLDAIRSGEVDAVVVSGARGNQIYSLAGAEQPYRVYVERMQEGAVTVSAGGWILYCNQFFADLIRMPLERVISSEILEHLTVETWGKLSTLFGGAEKVVKHETSLLRADGSQFAVQLTASRLPMDDQDVICLVVTDLTEQKKQGELRLAKELAEKANLAKDDFLAALSHELRTPLTPVLMATAALEQSAALPESMRESLTMIRRNVELEARLIDDLLDLTRIARGKMLLQMKAMDFHTVLGRAVETCGAAIASKSLAVTLSLEATQFQAGGDAVRLQQAMWNLIRNAVKFIKNKGSIVIRTRNPAPDRILFEVEDNGVGFDPSSAGKLFQAFEQGGRHITRRFGGLGLGLAITRSIIEAHGGTVSAASKGVGQGATFTLEIPLRSGPMKTEITAEPITRPQGEFSSKRILLVEDHDDTRNNLEVLLQRAAYLVKSASNAEEALELAETNEFDLVISDVGLPDQSGLELMQKLKTRFNLRGIGLSGYGMEGDVAKGREAGFIQYLTKPVRFEQLREAIERF
jgi:PAS domain S-box-containing protein